MSVSHVGSPRPLAVVPQQQSPPAPNSDPTGLDRNLLPDVRKELPSQAKGAAVGLSVQKFFDKWDTDHDGTITQAEAGPRWGHGVLGELLKLQEDGADAASATDVGGSPAGQGSPAPGASPPAGDGAPAGSTDATDPSSSGAAGPTSGATGSDAGAPGAGGTDLGATGDTPPSGAGQLSATLTPPPPTGDLTPDPTQLLDGSAA